MIFHDKYIHFEHLFFPLRARYPRLVSLDAVMGRRLQGSQVGGCPSE